MRSKRIATVCGSLPDDPRLTQREHGLAALLLGQVLLHATGGVVLAF